MAIRKTVSVRVDKDFVKKAREIMNTRLIKGLAQPKLEEIGLPEFTRLQLRCPSWRKVEEELKNLPKKR